MNIIKIWVLLMLIPQICLGQEAVTPRIINQDSLNCVVEYNKEVCEEANLQPFTGIAIMRSGYGTVLGRISYKNGLVDGKVKGYDINGYMYYEADCKEGEVLKYTCYDKNGNKIRCNCNIFNWKIRKLMKRLMKDCLDIENKYESYN